MQMLDIIKQVCQILKILLNIVSKRYSGKSFKDASVMKKPKLSLKEKRKIKKEKKKNKQLLYKKNNNDIVRKISRWD